MKIDKKFFVQVLSVLGVLVMLAVYPLLRYGNREVVVASIVGAVLATVNVLVGYLAIEYSIGKSHSTFLKAVLGGMAVRMGIMLSLLVVLIEIFRMHAVALAVSLLSCYAVYLVLEVAFVQKKIIIKNQN